MSVHTSSAGFGSPRNNTHDIRGDIPIPKVTISPWGTFTIEADSEKNRLIEEFNAAIMGEDLSTIENLFANLYEMAGKKMYAYDDLLEMAIANQKENALLLFLDLIKKTFDSDKTVKPGLRDDFERILSNVIHKCINNESYDLMHTILEKFGGYQKIGKYLFIF